MRVACVMMQRNEDLCLQPWLVWHGHLFGFENLYIIDHGSEDRSVQEILSRFEALGVHIMRMPATADYRRKAEYTIGIMQILQKGGGYDFLLPLDCDEFVVMRDAAGQPSCAVEEILRYLDRLKGNVFAVPENFLNILGHPGQYFILPNTKIFFRSGAVRPMDHGSHRCVDNTPATATRLVYTHFYHKAFARQKEKSLEKLGPFVDVNDQAALAAYRGTGQHLITHVLQTEAEYMALMAPNASCVSFPALGEMFELLGIDPGFYEE
jgi:hypothetical protein